MIFTKLTINNFYNFSNAELDLFIRRKSKSSTIDDENLADYPNFNYKKVCILSGTNSSGKTAIGRILMFVQNLFVSPTIRVNIINAIKNSNEEATIVAEFFLVDSLYELVVSFIDKEIKYHIRSYKLRKTDSYFQARKMLDLECLEEIINFYAYIISKQLFNIGWLYLLTETEDDSNDLSNINYLSADLLYRVLHSFDSSIHNVNELSDDKGKLSGFEITFTNGDTVLIDKEGNTTNPNRFSTGTFKSIKIVYLLGRIIEDNKKAEDGFAAANFYFLDEVMAYVHSDLEVAIINLIIQYLKRDCQFIYTTHNVDILDMNLPHYSYAFLRKEKDRVSIVNTEKIFNKNDRRIASYVRNNRFNSLPSTDLIDELL